MNAEIVDLGASDLDPTTNAVTYQAKGSSVDNDDQDAPDFGSAPVFACLGVTARPAPANSNGKAQGVVLAVPGLDGVIVGARDTRTADVVAKLADGETCLHSTGDGFDSRVFCKDGAVAIVVGDDTVISVDRKNKKITIAGFGHLFEMSADNGIVLADASQKSGITINNGIVTLVGVIAVNVTANSPPTGLLMAAKPPSFTAATALPVPGFLIGGI